MSNDTIQELAIEVRIPINDCFISLNVPSDFFKPEFVHGQSQELVDAQNELSRLNTQQALLLQGLALQPPFIQVAFADLPDNPGLVAGLIVQTSLRIAELTKSLRPQLFLVESYRLTTQRTATGKGPEVNTMTLAAGQIVEVATTTEFSKTSDLTKTTTAMESQDTSVAQNFNTHVADSSNQSNSQDSSDYHMDANFHGDASVGFGSGEANAQLGVKGGSNDVRTSFGKATESAQDKQIGETAASRQLNVSQASSQEVVTGKVTVINKSTIQNPNPTRTLNLFWFQLVEEYHSFLSLVDVGVAFRNKDRAQDQQVALHDLDGLLKQVLDPSKVQEVRDGIKGELEVVLDYQANVRNIVEEVPFGPTHTILRLTRDLQTPFVLKDGNGNPLRTIHVEGVVIQVTKKDIPSKDLVLDQLVGEHDALAGSPN